jgi:glycosyltransferase involved in cell wall biosynthesis
MTRSVKNIVVLRMLSIMAQSYASQNIHVTAYGLENPAKSLGLEKYSDNLRVIPWDFLARKSVFDDIRAVRELLSLLRSEKPQVVHVNALQDLWFCFIVSRLLPAGDRPVIIGMTHNPYTWKNPRKTWLASIMIRLWTDGFICLSSNLKKQLAGLGVPDDRIVMIPNPYDDEHVRLSQLVSSRPKKKDNGSVRIVCISSICERKGQDVLIRAAELVLRKYPNVAFDLVGAVYPGDELYAQKIMTMLDKPALAGRVRYLGAVAYQEVMEVLAATDIFVYPTHMEMMPRGVIEAMLAGKPVVASALEGILDLIEHGKTGLLVQPGDEIELAAAICELIEKPAFAESLAVAGQSFILEYCSPNHVGQLHRNFYQAVLDGRA